MIIKGKIFYAIFFLFFIVVTLSSLVGAIQVDLVYPSNDTRINETSQIFSCNATSSEENLTKIIFYIWNSDNTSIHSETIILGNNSNTTTKNFTYVLPYSDIFQWNCQVYGNNGTYNYSSDNFWLRLFATIEEDGLAETYYYFYAFLFLIPLILLIIGKRIKDLIFIFFAGVIFILGALVLLITGFPNFTSQFILTSTYITLTGLGFWLMLGSGYKMIRGEEP